MNAKTTLYVLAGGLGSRYGGLKQMESFGPSGETIIDYSIYDAINSGIDNVLFVIRKDMEEAFKEVYMDKYKGKVDIDYIFQDIADVPDWYKQENDISLRQKPWGTGHAVLVAKNKLNNPFLVINGDDFYGRESFQKAAKFLREECSENESAIISYKLKNVLSDNGTVKRGICTVKDEHLDRIAEAFELKRNPDNTITGEDAQTGEKLLLQDDTNISMNMFCLSPYIFEHLQNKFDTFLHSCAEGEEFILPNIFNELIKEGKLNIKSIDTNGTWFGVTYKEDAPSVRENIQKLIDDGIYPSNLIQSYK